MKKIILILSLFSIIDVYSQTIKEGFYSTIKKDVGFEKEYFHFFNGNFRYLIFGCQGSSFGIGKYLIKNDSIVLAFENFDYDSEKIKIDKIKSLSDSLKLDLKIFDRSGEIPGANFDIDKKVFGYSDFNGNFVKIIPKSDKLRILKISFIGYSPIEIKIEKEVSEIKGTIHITSNWKYSNEDKLVFQIVKASNTQIKLSRSVKTITYRKISREHVIKDLKKSSNNEDIDYYIKYL